MADILVVHGSIEGQTEKIARKLGDWLAEKGHRVDLVPGEHAPHGIRLTGYDGVIVGSSVHMLRLNSAVQRWVKYESSTLGKMPSVFFSVCLGILEERGESSEKERKIVKDFFADTGWSPERFAIFAGALKYAKYGWFKRQLMKWIAKRAGGETDTSRDYEYTNWNDVRAFAERFHELLENAKPPLKKTSQ